MNTYESEQEQLEALQKWWKENGRAVIAGLLIGAVAIIGWTSWRVYTAQQAENASLQYEQLVATAKRNQQEKAIEQGERLIEEFPGSGYAGLASLVIAKVAFQQDDVEKAKTYLRWAIDQGEPVAIKQIARIRLARLLADEKKGEEAITLLNGDTGEFTSLYEEVRGDILLLGQDNPADARAAYERSTAMSILSSGQSRSRLQTKLNDLGNPEAIPEPEEPKEE
uniref:Ancillary SecYEG translocon subunit n=1 Tax=Candidatus Kentrum sp. DK TaxID=2126562 RepID=A0A450RTH5_9GAMM|nr:MAG: Putative negative regulator of RcsB-dependent stress response [Candidatus Kentron sp. DK]VFJ45426.1 MAG: Putative negative regulator of RcsB-dependent stress response [Candidatus Kentron sp. DK]